ncbi:hypothetical protein D918_01616 [Trichuris suis]|nr:hypothetical protein D918_01616 [Trichuris suis]
MTFLAARIAIILFVWQVSTVKYNRGGTPQGEREPLRCEDHLGRRACLRKIMRAGFAERCRNSRLLYRYHCCRSCARHIGIYVTPDGFFRDVGNFTYYDPTCPNLIDRAAKEGREDVFCMIIYATFRENACAGPMAQYSCAKTCRLSCGRQELKKKVPSRDNNPLAIM